jgi:hypothetical protein
LRPQCGPRFTISLKRSTLIFSYPQAGRPITPSFGGKADINRDCLTIVIHSAVRIERFRHTAAMNIVCSADNLLPRLTVFAQMP